MSQRKASAASSCGLNRMAASGMGGWISASGFCAALMAFARDAARLLFEGSVSFAPPEPSSQTTETTTRDIGLMCASDGAWLITPHATQADAVDVNSISAAGLNRVWQMALAQN